MPTVQVNLILQGRSFGESAPHEAAASASAQEDSSVEVFEPVNIFSTEDFFKKQISNFRAEPIQNT